MKKHDLAVIGIGIVALAVTIAAVPASADDPAQSEPAPVATDAPSMTPEQQAQYDAWPSDRQVMFDGWSAEAQAYFWSLSPARQDFFWQLSDDDRATIIAMEPVEREEAWQMVEGRMAEPPAP